MTTSDLVAGAALLCSTLSLVIVWLAYRRSAIDSIVELRVQHFPGHLNWWFVTASIWNRTGTPLTPTQLHLSRSRSARFSAYLDHALKPEHSRQLPEGVRNAPKSISQQDLGKLTRSFAPGGNDEFSVIVFVSKRTSRLLSIDLTVRKRENQKSDIYSAQAYLPLA